MADKNKSLEKNEPRALVIHSVSNCVCKKPEIEHIHGIIRVCIKCGKKA